MPVNFEEKWVKIKNRDASIWRFMDFAKFMHLISSSSLYFAATCKLDDPFEGSFLPSKLLKADGNEQLFSEEQKQRFRIATTKNREALAVSCWHVNEQESAAMWQIYVPRRSGIAVRSTINGLKNSLDCPPKSIIDIGMIRYIDYENETFQDDNSINLFEGILHKRKSYEHEKELRAVLLRADDHSSDSSDTIDMSFSVPVNLSEMIQDVYISPRSQPWITELVKSVLKTYKLDAQVRQSALDSVPLY